VHDLAASAKAELARRVLGRRRLLHFMRQITPSIARQPLIEGWHMIEMVEEMEKWARGERLRKMIMMPPRHGKSYTLACAVAWLLGWHESAKVIFATYSAKLATDFVRMVRRVMNSERYKVLFPDARIGNVDQALEFEMADRTSSLLASGVGGGITGRTMTHGLVDDPIRGRQDAESEVFRDRVWDWYQNDFLTRQTGNGGEVPIVVVHTRWHEEDLIGRLLSRKHNDWSVTKYPAILDDGSALCPELVSLKALQRHQDEKSPRDWMSLYQQEPVTPGGEIIKLEWLKAFTVEADHVFYWNGNERRRWPVADLHWYYTLDVAATEKQQGDWSVLAQWAGIPEGPLCLWGIDRVQVDAPKLVDLIIKRQQERPGTAYIEKNGVGLPVIQFARRKGLPVRELEAHRDKVARAEGVTPFMEAGKLMLPENAPWLGRLHRELASFPLGAHDDQVDAVVYGCQVWQGQRRYRRMLNAPRERVTQDKLFDGVAARL